MGGVGHEGKYSKKLNIRLNFSIFILKMKKVISLIICFSIAALAQDEQYQQYPQQQDNVD